MGCLRLSDEKNRSPLKVVYKPMGNFIFTAHKQKQNRPFFCLSNYQYKYNAKEFQDELGLNMYAMDMRQYDPAIARWVVHDPIVHFYQSPYSAFDGNPVFWADPSGASVSESVFENLGGTQTGSFTDMATGTSISAGGAGDDEKDNDDNGDPKNGDPKKGNDETNSIEQNCCPDKKPKIEVKLSLSSETKSINLAFVQNDFNETVYYKSEEGSEKEFIRTNGTIHEKIDGIRVGNTVIKVSDGYRSVVVDKNGNVNITYGDPVSYGAYLLLGGQLKSSPDSNWNALFDKK